MSNKRTPINILVYWDINVSPEGWAYRASDELGVFKSGTIELDDDNAGLDVAIGEACRILGVQIPIDAFAISRDDGGYGQWTKSE